MIRNIHIHIHHTRVKFINKIIPLVVKAQALEPGLHPIIEKRFLFGEATGIKRYDDIIRLLGGILGVTCLRNSYNSYEGIVVVGREPLVSAFNNIFKRIVELIYKETSNAPAHPKMKGHLSEYRANLRTKAVALFIKQFKELKEFRDAQVDLWYQTQEKVKRDEYIKNSPLKAKKAYRH
jgi:hypothetical protein